MRILVLGGVGFIGSHLTENLINDGHDIVSLDKQVTDKRVKGITYIQADVTDKKSMLKAFEKADVVYHLVSLIEKWEIPEEDYWKVNFEGTKNVFDLCVKNDVKQLIYASSASVIGPVRFKPLNENGPYDSSTFYKQTKIESEKFLLSKSDSLPTTIVRPELVYGPGDLHHLKLFKAIKEKRFLMPSPGKNIIQPSFIDDIIQGFKLLLMNKKAFGKKFIIAGKEIVTSRQFVDIIAENLQTAVPKFSIPFFISKSAALSFEFLGKTFDFVPPLTQSNLELFTVSHAYDISFARKKLGYKPKINLKEGIRITVDWYKEKNLL